MTVKTVLIACDTFAPDHNGSAVFARNLACGLQERGYEVHVIAPAVSKLYGTFREQHDGIPLVVHRLKSYRLPFHPTQRFVSPLGLTKRIFGLTQAIKPDVVHIQSHINVGHHAATAAAKGHIKLVATNHVDAENLVENVLLAPKFLRRFLAELLLKDAGSVFKAASAVIAPTTRSAQLLSSAIPNLEVITVSGGVDLSRFLKVPEADQKFRKISYVGRLDREKHVYVLLEALAKVDTSITLDLIGYGSQHAELVSLANELGISKRVRFFEDLTDSQVVQRLGKASAFVMPSIQELQSMATLEAMAAARPILAADSMALPGLVESGVNGFLFKPDSAVDLAAKIAELFDLDAKTFKKMGAASRQRAKLHDLAKSISNYERIYSGLPILSTTTDDDSEALEPTVGERLTNLVKLGSKSIEKGANGVLERLDGVRGAVSETFTDVRFTIERRSKRMSKRISSSLRKALERIRRDD